MPRAHVFGGALLPRQAQHLDLLALASRAKAGFATMGRRSNDGAAVRAPATGQMEIILPGDRQVIVDRAVDPSVLARMIAVLERR